MPYDIVIVGGGIIGLATAYQILVEHKDLKLAIIEKENQLAKHQSGNNSGVIHSGLYYKPGGLKAHNCIRGYHMLLDFAQQENILHEICGKIVVAISQEEVSALKFLYTRGKENGLKGLKMIDAAGIKEIEPHCFGVAGIKVPHTGIIDYSAICERLGKRIKELGGEIFLKEQVLKIDINKRNVHIHSNNKTFRSTLLINCAGLYSDKVARMTSETDTKIIPFRGEYYELKPEKRYLVKHLIYPVPNPNFPFLGVHFTRMINGGIEAGPNAVLAYAREGYTKSKINLNELLETLAFPGFIKIALKYWETGLGEFYRSYFKSAFTQALQKLIPEIQETDLVPGGAGVRAQACNRNGDLLDDFKIVEGKRVINVINTPSPAATSCLSIGKTIAKLSDHKLKQ